MLEVRNLLSRDGYQNDVELIYWKWSKQLLKKKMIRVSVNKFHIHHLDKRFGNYNIFWYINIYIWYISFFFETKQEHIIRSLEPTNESFLFCVFGCCRVGLLPNISRTLRKNDRWLGGQMKKLWWNIFVLVIMSFSTSSICITAF